MNATKRQGIISSTVKYVRLKQYQFEVTFCPYVLTPTEKFVFNLILLTLLAIVVMEVTYHLPHLLESVFVRVWYLFVAMQSTKGLPIPSEMRL